MLSWLLMFYRWTEIKVEFVPLWEKGRGKVLSTRFFQACPTSLVLPSFWHGNLIVFCFDIPGPLFGFHSSFLTWLGVSWETAIFASQSKLNPAIQAEGTSMGREKMWPQNGDFYKMSFLQGLAEGFESGKQSQWVRKKMEGLSRSQPEERKRMAKSVKGERKTCITQKSLGSREKWEHLDLLGDCQNTVWHGLNTCMEIYSCIFQ